MTAVTLGTAWLNVASDPSDWVSLPTMSSLSVSTMQAGDVRRLANGRLRSVTRAGQMRSFDLSVESAPRAEIDWLEDHVGQVVCVRDDRGRKVFALYFAVDVEETRGNADLGGVSVSLTEVSWSEAV